MKNFSIIKVGLAFLLMLNSLFVFGITFNTSSLKDSSSSNYTGFTNQQGDFNDKFEKIIADFNGDGFDDILSLGGNIPCSLCSPQPPPFPVELLLFDNGEYIYHKINTFYSKDFVSVVDIDQDGDMDILSRNGTIAINDGSANFSLLLTGMSLPENFYTLDWNGDNATDIVTNAHIFINDGNLNFSQISNTVANGNQILIANLDTNTSNDMLVIEDNQLQSWVQDTVGEFSISSSLVIDQEIDQVKAIDVNSDGAADFIVVSSSESGPIIQLLINDGMGQLDMSDFDFSQINEVSFDEMNVSKVFVQDADGDGDSDLWINATFTSTELQCENKQNLLLIYENIAGGNLQYKRSLHNIGYKNDYFYGETPTENFPTLIDLNQDNKLDVVMPGESPVAWIQYNQFYYGLSNVSSLQFNKYIQVVDFNNDGNADILSTGKYEGSCQSLSNLSNNNTLLSITSNMTGGRLWLGDGQGKFNPYSTGIAGLTNFNIASEYSKLVDVFQDGNYLAINTFLNYDDSQRMSTISYPMLTDPGIQDELPVVTKLVEAADLTNNGNLEIVMLADDPEAAIYVMAVPNNAPLPSEVLAKLDFGFPDGEIKLVDMDNDGFVDIVTNSKSQSGAITIWYNNGDGTFDASVGFANDVKAIAISDFDGDGRKDIFSSNENHEIWFNQGDRNFASLDYDSSFLKPLWFISPLVYGNLVPEKIEVSDVNSDGMEDLIFYIQNEVHVYLKAANSPVSFYKNYSSVITYSNDENGLQNSNVAFADFNNDGRMDFVSGSDNFIKINLQTDINLSSGLYFDEARNGHGFSIEELGIDNLFYSVFYTYDDFGNPDWYSILHRYQANENIWRLDNMDNISDIHYLYDYQTGSTRFDNSLSTMGWFDFYNSKDENKIDNAFIRIAETPVTWRLNEIISDNLKPNNDLSGIWWAGIDDAGWGISLSFVQRENSQELVAILYFYDEFGNPRWLIGQSTGFETNQDIVLDMKQINGYGRMQNYVELTEISAGTITLNLQQASKELGQAGSMSMDVFYPDDQPNDNWVRNNIPISLFSKPRDQ